MQELAKSKKLLILDWIADDRVRALSAPCPLGRYDCAAQSLLRQAGPFRLFRLLASLNYTCQTPNRSTEPSLGCLG